MPKEADDLMEHIARLFRMVRRRPTDEQCLSRGAHRLLHLVLQNEGIRTTDLAERMGVRPASLTELLRRLDEGGYLRREKDENDSRVIRVFAAKKAFEEHVRLEAEHRERNARLRACLTDDEARMFCAICDKLCVFLEKEQPPVFGRERRHEDEACRGFHHGSERRKCRGDGEGDGTGGDCGGHHHCGRTGSATGGR